MSRFLVSVYDRTPLHTVRDATDCGCLGPNASYGAAGHLGRTPGTACAPPARAPLLRRSRTPTGPAQSPSGHCVFRRPARGLRRRLLLARLSSTCVLAE